MKDWLELGRQAGIGWSLANARACCELSRLAYDEPATVESGICHVVVIERPWANLIGFRGTHNLPDLLADLRIRRQDHCHAGFLASFNSVKEALAGRLALLPKDKPTFIGGHSKGAAEAVHCMRDFGPLFPQCELHTFGEPRGGDAFWAAECDGAFGPRHFRHVNQEDIVPRVPPWLMRNRHSGREIFFPSMGGMRFGAPLWLKLVSDVYGTYMERKRHELAQYADHALTKYEGILAGL